MKKLLAIALAFSTMACQSKEKKTMTETQKSEETIDQKNLEIAAQELCWEKEEEKLLALYSKVVSENF